MEFRRMAKSDRQGVQDFFNSLEGDSATFFNRSHGNENRTMAWFDDRMPDHEFFVMEEEGVIIGVSFIWNVESRIPWFGIGVRNAWQGKHVGTKMLTSILDMLRERGCGGLLLTTAQTNFKGQGLYEKCGFERLGVYPDGEFLYLHRFSR